MSAIAVIDSGVGGLTVLQELVRCMPHKQYLYCADTQHAPYGEKSFEELLRIVRHTVEYILTQGITYIVVACNTISGNVIAQLAKEYPHITFITMLAHGLHALSCYQHQYIGLLATSSTITEGSYAIRVTQHCPHAILEGYPASQLVLWAEKGHLQGSDVESYLYGLANLFTNKPDVLILGCTHFPFFLNSIQHVFGENTILYNPAYSVAQYVITQCAVESHCGDGGISWYVTGDDSTLYRFATAMGLY